MQSEAMFAQCDEDGNEYVLFDSFVDFRRDGTALSLADQKVVVKGRPSLSGQLLVGCCWKDGSTSWEKLSDLKESHPVQTAEYAVAQGIDHEPAFNWWVPCVPKKRDSISQPSARYLKRTHKWGLEVPQLVDDALAIDKRSGNTFWADAIAEEMKNVRVAFKILDDGERPPPGFQFIRCHMIFDIKMEDFRRKAQLVADGHVADVPPTITYSSVVGRRLSNWKKIWTILGPEFGDDQGKKAVIVRALYGLKSAGASFRHHLADCMKHLGYHALLILIFHPDDGVAYYAYIPSYVDDILSIAHNADGVLRPLDKYMLKPGSLGDPDIYFGAKLKKMKSQWC
eukprot:CCRYP_021053-RA/>CCRYP_021053-RA protein AED:0.33 eAED:0.33 QI:0/0/0/1/0.33/0.25/4/0/339